MCSKRWLLTDRARPIAAVPIGGRTIVAALTLGIAAACASPATMSVSGAPTPRPLAAGEADVLAELLRLEDSRDRDAATIAAAAGSDHPVVRSRAVLAAARNRAPDALPLVLSLLGDGDTLVAATAAFAAGLLGDTAAVPALAALLDPDVTVDRPTVAAEAAAALGHIGGTAAREALVGFLRTADVRAAGVAPVAREALLAAWRIEQVPTDLFARWLESADPEIRWRAAYALTRPPRAENVPLLLPLLEDPDPLTRSFALRGLARPAATAAGIPPADVLPRIVAAAADSAYPVRMEAIRVAATYAEPEAAELLAALLVAEGATHEKAAALESLGRIGPAAASFVPTLELLLADPLEHPYLRALSLASLVAIDVAGAPQRLQAASGDPDWRVRAAAAQAAAALRTEAIAILEALARDSDPRVAVAAVQAAITALGATNIHQIRSLLVELLQSPDVHVRAEALRAFSWLADPSTLPVLLDAFEAANRDTESEARIAALDAIAELRLVGQSPERAFFARFSRPSDPRVWRRAVERFGNAAVSAWGMPPTAVQTRTTPVQYREYVDRWIAPTGSDLSRPRVVVETGRGTFEVELFADDAPLTVANFLQLAAAGYFDGQEWPRVIPNFVAQGGDPRGDTSGGPGYTIRDEVNRNRYQTGTLGMALSGPDTGGSQFFVTHSPQPHLDGGYTVFGRVVKGQEVVDALLPGDALVSVREVESIPQTDGL